MLGKAISNPADQFYVMMNWKEYISIIHKMIYYDKDYFYFKTISYMYIFDYYLHKFSV